MRVLLPRCKHRLHRSGSAAHFAALLTAVTLLVALPCGAASHTDSSHTDSAHTDSSNTDSSNTDSSRTAKTAPRARVTLENKPFGASCRTAVDGSHVTAYCHNPYPEPDHVGLHIECDRWWDIDTDGPRVEAGPAQRVRLVGRCWKEVRSAWVSHQR